MKMKDLLFFIWIEVSMILILVLGILIEVSK